MSKLNDIAVPYSKNGQKENNHFVPIYDFEHCQNLILHKYLGCQLAPITQDFSCTADRLRLMVCQLIADYHNRESHH